MIIPIGIILIFIIRSIVKLLTRKPKTLENKHVFITGGSSGIGKAIAEIAVKQGAHVTIIARNLSKLQSTEDHLKKFVISNTQKITIGSVDVTNYDDVKKYMLQSDNELPIYMLVNCAGFSICGKIEDMPIEGTKKILDINFYGTYFPIKAIIPQMKARKEGHIIITGSQASLLGIFGFTSYSASKYALRGLAEALDMEVRVHNVNVTLALPPDTDTPGFEQENLTKLEETKLICESGGLFKAEVVAKKILDDSLEGRFMSSIGFESYILTTLCTGMTRHSSVFQLILQCILLGPLKLISAFYLASFNKIIKRAAEKKIDNKKKN